MWLNHINVGLKDGGSLGGQLLILVVQSSRILKFISNKIFLSQRANPNIQPSLGKLNFLVKL